MNAKRGGGRRSGMNRRIERAGVGPERVMPMQNPGRDHHHRTPRQMQIADLVGQDRFAHQSERGREKP
jgi:hypothetical protein